MTKERIVPYGWLGFVVFGAVMLSTIIARSPNTHGNLWNELPPDYARTPVDTIEKADLEAIVAQLPAFVPPASNGSGVVLATNGAPVAGGQLVSAVTTAAVNGAGAFDGRPVGDARRAPVDGLATGAGEVQQFAFAIPDGSFSPSRLDVKAGVPVELTVTNTHGEMCAFSLPELGVAVNLTPGQKKVLRFTPGEPGQYRGVCPYSLWGNAQDHAHGTLFVNVQ